MGKSGLLPAFSHRRDNLDCATVTTADTLVPDPTNPQQFNRYAYVLNNPLRFTDPSGHFSEEAIWNYVSNSCSGGTSCINNRWDLWRSNASLWDMLREAQTGDILFIGIHHDFFAYGAFYSFNGHGQDTLSGITLSDAYGNSIRATGGKEYLNHLTLINIFQGNVMGDAAAKASVVWGGYSRWNTVSGEDGLSFTAPTITSRDDLSYDERENTWVSRIFQWATGQIPYAGWLISSEGSTALGIDDRTLNVNIGAYDEGHQFSLTFRLENQGFSSTQWRYLRGSYTIYEPAIPVNTFSVYGSMVD